jgi:hypothetical protein
MKSKLLMYNQHDQLTLHSFQEATKLASQGEEFSHLVKFLTPEYGLRLKIFVQSLPQSVAEKTIYGKVHWNDQSKTKKKR